MANRKILIGDILNGVVVHRQEDWSPGDRLVDPDGSPLARLSELNQVRNQNLGTSPPTSTEDGVFWLDSSTDPYVLRVYRGGGWQEFCRVSTSGIILEGGTL